MAFGHDKESDFVVKEAPDRANFPSGMNRGSQRGKTNYRLIDWSFLTRLANHLTKGAEIYGRDNWRKANSQEELDRFLDSANRHFMQYLNGETDEDHMAAVCFNMMAAEHTKIKIGSEVKNDYYKIEFNKQIEFWRKFWREHNKERTNIGVLKKSSLDEDIIWLVRNIPEMIHGEPTVTMRLAKDHLYLTFIWPRNILSRRISFEELESVFDISCLAESIAIEINNKYAEA